MTITSIRKTLTYAMFALLSLALPSATHAIGARPLGLGGAYYAISDDEQAVFYNAAGLSQIDGRTGAATFKVNERGIFLEDRYAFTGHVYDGQPQDSFSISDYLEHNVIDEPAPRRPKFSYGMGILSQKRSPQYYDIVGSDLGTKFTRMEGIIAGAARFPIAKRFASRERLFAGVKLRYGDVESRLPSLNTRGRRTYGAFDAGVLYHYSDNVIGGIQWDNLAEYSNGGTEDPVTMNFGLLFKINKESLLTFDITNVTRDANSNDSQFRIGVEKVFLENDFIIRMGSFNGSLTLGTGIRITENLNLDYAYVGENRIKEHHVSASMKFK